MIQTKNVGNLNILPAITNLGILKWAKKDVHISLSSNDPNHVITIDTDWIAVPLEKEFSIVWKL